MDMITLENWLWDAALEHKGATGEEALVELKQVEEERKEIKSLMRFLRN